MNLNHGGSLGSRVPRRARPAGAAIRTVALTLAALVILAPFARPALAQAQAPSATVATSVRLAPVV